jgi:hypothetical protein
MFPDLFYDGGSGSTVQYFDVLIGGRVNKKELT